MRILGIKGYGINQMPIINKFKDGGGISEIVTGMIPIYGTYQDAKKFAKDPTWDNLGWAITSGIGDILFFTGAGAGIKSLKAARAANAARKALALKRSQKLLESERTFYDTRLARIAGESSSQEMKAALQSLKTARSNFLLNQDKLKASERIMLGEAQKLGKSSLQDLTKDGIIQTTQVLTE